MTFVQNRGAAWVLLLATSTSLAQEPAKEPADTPAASELETWVAPSPIQRSAPDYPDSARSRGREGWVALSFIVSKEGKFTDAMIEDSTGNEETSNVRQSPQYASGGMRLQPGMAKPSSSQ